ncbi:hypothetical protein, partial [Azotobacter chroococcum]|uniref:hypothetical protein n=1 Tax=Azotobacter chroococcum TaxID=353 RepID=UPI001B8BCEB8
GHRRHQGFETAGMDRGECLGKGGVQELDGLHGAGDAVFVWRQSTSPVHAGLFKPYLSDFPGKFLGITQGLSAQVSMSRYLA